MTHDIYVCLTHKQTFHSLHVGGRHGMSHTEITTYPRISELLRRGTWVKIGVCDKCGFCERCKLIPSTTEELSLAEKMKDQSIKEELQSDKEVKEIIERETR